MPNFLPGFDGLRRYVKLPRLSRARVAADVDRDIEHHLAMRADALERAGVSPEDARAQAVREFGDIDDARDYCTDLAQRTERRAAWRDWLLDARLDAVHAVRLTRRFPTFTWSTIAVLAIAIGASTAAVSVLRAYLVRPLPFPQPERLVSVVPGPSLDVFPRSPSLNDVDWTRVDSLFEFTAAWDLDGFTLSGGSRPDYVDGAWVSAGFFKTLGLEPAIGRGFTQTDFATHAPVALISDALWSRRYARDPHVVGSVVPISSTDRPREQSFVTIVGVLPHDFWHLNQFTDLLRPLPESRMPSLGRLKANASMAETEAQVDAAVRAQLSSVDSAWHMSLFSARDEHAASVRPILIAVVGAALLMLLAACGSVSGGLVGRMTARRQELAIRTALGGTGGRIVRQLVVESVFLATIAGVLGATLSRLFVDAASPLIERQLGASVPGGPEHLAPDLQTLAAAILLSACTGVAFGLVPAVVFLHRDRRAAGAALRSGIAGHVTGSRVRQSLVWCELSLAVVLLFGAGLMVRTVMRLQTVDLGFRPDGVLKVTVLLPVTRYADSTARRDGMRRVLMHIRSMPGVRAAAAVFPYPLRNGPALDVVAEGTTGAADAPRTLTYTVSDDYFSTMGIGVLAGRAFDVRDDARAALVTIVSGGLAARLWKSSDPIGRRIRVGDARQPWRTVIGVAHDVRNTMVVDGPAAENVYVPYAQSPRAYESIVVRASGSADVHDAVRRAVTEADPELALSEVEPLADVIARQGASRRGLAVLLGAFSAFALALSAIGLYASLSYLVQQRQLEFAVRIAVGAQTPAIVRLVMTEGVVAVGGGLATGVVASLALGRLLEHQVVGVETHDPVTLVAASAVLVVAALVAILLPAVRATKADPALALRGV